MNDRVKVVLFQDMARTPMNYYPFTSSGNRTFFHEIAAHFRVVLILRPLFTARHSFVMSSILWLHRIAASVLHGIRTRAMPEDVAGIAFTLQYRYYQVLRYPVPGTP